MQSESAAGAAVEKQKKQLKIIAVLALGLVLALVMQPPKESGSSDELALIANPVANKLSPEASPIESPPQAFVDTKTLSRISLSDAMQKNLFQNPVEPPRVVEVVEVEEEQPPQRYRVQAIYGTSSSTSRTALLQSEPGESKSGQKFKIVRPGRPIADGVRVLRIKKDRIDVTQ